jgi:hypothetical protein
MHDIYEILQVAKIINDKISTSTFNNDVQIISRLRAINPATRIAHLTEAVSAMDRIINLVGSLNFEQLKIDNYESILIKLNLNDLVGDQGIKYLLEQRNSLNASITTNTGTSTTSVNAIITNLNRLKNTASNAMAILQPFSMAKANSDRIQPDEGIIEIVFDGKMGIDNFESASKQMDDWFIIIEGYARLAGVTREDFQIVSISKQSPAKFKIKTGITNTVIVLQVITSLLQLHNLTIERKTLIDKLEKNPIISDKIVHEAYINSAKAEIDSFVDTKIVEIVEQQAKEHNIGKDQGDITANLTKGIQYQYNFVINGGNVNFQVINGEVQKQIDSVEIQKKEIKLIQERLENQKKIDSDSIN